MPQCLAAKGQSCAVQFPANARMKLCESLVKISNFLLTYYAEYGIIIVTGGGETPTGQELDSSRKRGKHARWSM